MLVMYGLLYVSKKRWNGFSSLCVNLYRMGWFQVFVNSIRMVFCFISHQFKPWIELIINRWFPIIKKKKQTTICLALWMFWERTQKSDQNSFCLQSNNQLIGMIILYYIYINFNPLLNIVTNQTEVTV